MAHLTDADDFREPTERERQLMGWLLSFDFPGRAELSAQFQTSRVREIDEDGCLQFQVAGPGSAPVRKRVPVEGEYVDRDGVTVHLLLHVADGYLQELEVYKEDNSPVLVSPHADVLRSPPWQKSDD